MKQSTKEKLQAAGFQPFKKTAITWARQMDTPFTCDTLEGDNIKGKAGDYLCIGVKGEVWPVDKEVFESTYTPAETNDLNEAQIVMSDNGKVKVVVNGTTTSAQG